MVSVKFDEEFDLPAQMASEIIINWLFSIKAKILMKDINLPHYIVAVHGSILHIVAEDPKKKKVLHFSINPLKNNRNAVKIHLEASIATPRRKVRLESIKQSWEENLFSELWEKLRDVSKKEVDVSQPQLELIKFINKIASKYNHEVPISRIQEKFGCDPRLIRHIIERYSYPTVDYIISDESIKVKPSDPIQRKIAPYIQEREEVYRKDKIEIKQMSKDLQIDKTGLIKLLIKFCGKNPSWAINEENKMIYKAIKGGYPYAILTEKKGGGFSFGFLKIEVGSHWKEIKFELKCSECGNKDKHFTFDKDFSQNGLLMCEKCKTTLQIPDFKKYFS